ncbi:MAG: primosomal protein [Microbacteriaceae bacterium]
MTDNNRGDRDRGPRKPGSGRPGGASGAPGRSGSGRPSGQGRPGGAGRPSGGGRPSSDGERKPWSRDGKPADGERKPWSRDAKPGDRPARPARDGERKPWSRDGKPADGERKPWSRDAKPGDRPARDGERKPWSREGKPADGERKPWSRDGKPSDRPARPARDGERKPWSRDAKPGDRPARPARDGERKPWSRDAKPGDRPARPARDGERKPWSKDGGRPSSPRDSRPGRPGGDRPQRDYDADPLTPWELKRREERALEPELESQFTGTNLDRAVIRDISTLNEDNKLIVGKHLESAAFFADSDPERALQHALAAKRRASRLAIVRETVGIMAYVNEDFALALAELRTAARISGTNEQVALIIDCLRALDRTEEGLKMARDIDRKALPREARIDLAIVLSGIRLDRRETDRAYAELQIPELDATNATMESIGLFDANAEVLEEMGRSEEAAKWRRYARATEAHFEPDEEITIRTEYPQPDIDVDAYDATDENLVDSTGDATDDTEDDPVVEMPADLIVTAPAETEIVEDPKQ